MKLPLAVIASCLLFASCGGGDDSADTKSKASFEGDSEDVEVVREWSEALTDGDIEAAAGLFALPSLAQNGFEIEIAETADAETFNDSLPCGAELESTEEDGDLIVATFRLTTRPGVAECPGEGATAQTAFKIEDGLIAEWRRVVPDQGPAPDPDDFQTT